MTRSNSRGPHARFKKVGRINTGLQRPGWLAALALPAVLGGCADSPRPTPYPAKPQANHAGFRLEAASARDLAPPRRPAQDTFAATLPELTESFSSVSIIEHILEQQRRTAELRAKQAASIPPIAATPHAPGNDTEQSAGSTDKKTRKARHGKSGRHGIATADPANGPLESSGRGKGGKTPTSREDSLGTPPRAARKLPDQWETVRGNLVLAAVDHEAISAQLEHLRNHPGGVDFLMRRAEPYLQYLLEEIKRENLPADLVIVPMVESAFETGALSPKAAAGIWQFIPSTGQRFGLPVSAEFDGRYDTHAATQAALKYLKHLNRLFEGDWLLALASYNAGEGAVQRAIDTAKRAGLEGSFWDLRLPAETEAYVVKIVALSRVLADPSAYGMKPRKAISLPFLTRVETTSEVKLADLMAAAGIPPEEFFKLNPAYKPDVEPPVRNRNFLLPPDRAEALQTANLPGTKVFALRRVVVQKGETLAILAKRHGVSEFKLATWNGLSLKSRLKAGQELLVYPV